MTASTEPKIHQYPTIYAWQHAQNIKTANRRKRKAATATRQATGQRARHNRRGHTWRNGRPSAMSSRSW